jgi:hypothetical protein
MKGHAIAPDREGRLLRDSVERFELDPLPV